MLSIIIVNYNSKQLIAQCLESAMQFDSYKQYEWIIVDNHSSDSSEAFLKNKFPFIRWISMQYNAGFARANNAGIKTSSQDIILLLNPDTIIIENALEHCVNKFVRSTHAACSVQLLNEDGSPQITGSYFMKGGLNHLLPLPYLGNFLRIIALGLKAKNTSIKHATTDVKVDWINGAFLMVKKDIFQKCGLMDEDFFLYAEEAEWCYRIGKYGQLYIYGDMHIKHLQGETINTETNSPEKGYQNIFDKKGAQLLVSNMLRIRKQEGIFWFLINMLIYTIEAPLFSIGLVLEYLTKKRGNRLYHFKQLNGYTKNIFLLWKLSPKILSGQSYFYKVI